MFQPASVTVNGALDSPADGQVSASVRVPIRSCVCRLGGDVVAVALRAAREFVRVEHLTAVPRTPSHLLGVTSLRGRIVPVVDIRSLLGLAPEGALGRGCYALVVQAGTVELAIAVEEILGLDSVWTDQSEDDEPLRSTPFRTRGVRPDGAVVSLLDVGPIAEALRPRPVVSAKEDSA
jgi:purine-binding chemotaxis protein CheW